MRRLWLLLPVALIAATAVAGRNLLTSADGRLPTRIGGETPDPDRLPTTEGFAELARTDPLGMLRACVARHAREVAGYTAVLAKRERVRGKLLPAEVIEVAFREEPYAVFMRWRAGAGRAERTLYAAGENGNHLLARPSGPLAKRALALVGKQWAERDPAGEEATAAARYPLTEFGLKVAAERTLRDWGRVAAAGELRVEYLGESEVPELGGVRCHTVRRTCTEPEMDGIAEVTLRVDAERWLMLGTRLLGAKGELIGNYEFRDVVLNPAFDAEQFKPAALVR